MSNQEIGVINEIGDLSLGFYPISEEDQKKIKKEYKDEEEE